MGIRLTSIRRAAGTVAIVALIAALAAPQTAQAQSSPSSSSAPGAMAVGFDAVVLRPLGFVAMVVGAILFVPTALITATNGRDGINDARAVFITPLVEEVFERPLGDF